jgi:PAS domain S-box-containing protein
LRARSFTVGWVWPGSFSPTGLALFLILKRQYSSRGTQAQRLQAASERLRAQVEISPLALVEWDEDFRVTRWSPRAGELFGWSEVEVLGRGWEDWAFVHPQDLSKVNEAVARSLERGEDGSVWVNRNFCKDGSVV